MPVLLALFGPKRGVRLEIEAALRQARGVKSRAAEALGLSRPTLDKKIADLGVDIWRDPLK